MSLQTLLEGWCDATPAVLIDGLSLDSRTVRQGEAFVAVGGEQTHGMKYALQAEALGATAVIHDGLADLPTLNIPTVEVPRLGERLSVLAARLDGADAKTLRDAVDRFKDKLQTAIVVLGSVDDGKVRLAAGVTKNTTDRIRAGDVIQPGAEQVGGRGGGRPDFAQAGGSDASALDAALASVPAWVSERLA